MKHSILWWQIAGFVFTAVVGTLLHFVFDWTGQSAIAAPFSAVNESIWEHLKLLFYPMLLFAFVEYRYVGSQYAQFWCIKLRGILFGLIFIPVIYYVYTGILGISADFFNVLIFFLAAAAVYRWETIQFQSGTPCRLSPSVSVFLLLLISLLFTVLTFYPPEIPFFLDPITETYGFQR